MGFSAAILRFTTLKKLLMTSSNWRILFISTAICNWSVWCTFWIWYHHHGQIIHQGDESRTFSLRIVESSRPRFIRKGKLFHFSNCNCAGNCRPLIKQINWILSCFRNTYLKAIIHSWKFKADRNGTERNDFYCPHDANIFRTKENFPFRSGPSWTFRWAFMGAHVVTKKQRWFGM